MLYYDRIDISEGIDLLKVTAAKNVQLATIGLIMDSTFKIMYVMVVMI